MNKSTTVAILGAILAVAALAVALPTMAHTAYAASASTGAFGTNVGGGFASATGAGSTGGAGSSAGIIALCPNFATGAGSCSEGAQ